MKKGEKRLNDTGIIPTTSNWGYTVFIYKDTPHTHNDPSINSTDWTVAQLRAIADYMEANPTCTIYDDGSGKNVRLK